MTTPYTPDDDGFERLIGALYEAPLRHNGLADTLRDFARGLHADNFHLLVWQAAEPTPRHTLSWGVSEAMESSYALHYGAIDPRRIAVAEAGEGRWLACHHRFNEQWVQRSEFFQDYLIPGDIRYLLGTKLVQDGARSVFYGMHRAPGREPFAEDALQWVNRITPHFQRAMRLWLHTEELRRQARRGNEALDAVEWGCVTVAGDGRVLCMNRYAEALLTGGHVLTTRLGRVRGVIRDHDKILQTALERVVKTRRATAVRLASDTAEIADHYSITIVPLSADGDFVLPWQAAPALMLIAPDQHRRHPSPVQLARLFGLTHAEARLLHTLAQGGTLESHALAHNVALSTVKTQLRAVLAKTGTRRQAELTRRVAHIAPARGLE